MTLPEVGDAQYPTPSDLRDGILTAIKYSFLRRGIEANVLPGSDHYIRADAYASRVSIALANNKIALRDVNPLTATGDALVELAGVFGVPLRPAAPSAGAVAIVSGGTVTIPSEFVGTAPNGKKYKTLALGTYASGAAVQLIAVSAGADTNQAAGTVLTWDDAAIGLLGTKATVTSGGITGGANADNDDRLRERLIDKLSAPPVGGNASSVIIWGKDASASVENVFVYQAVRGPASYDLAITKAGGNRTLAAATIAIVKNAVSGQMPGQNSINVTSVTPQLLDVVLAASLPLPALAGGAGGGWRDTSPWPGENVKVISYNGGTATARLQVSSTAVAPSVGNAIGLWDHATLDSSGNPAPVMREYVIASVSLFAAGPPALYDVTVQTGFAFDPTGCYLSAGAIGLTSYASTFAAAVAKLGPGQKTALAELLPLSLRKPGPDVQSPTDLTSLQTAVVTNAYPGEILGLDYGARFDTGTAVTRTSPSVALTTADPPNILVLKHLAIRKA